MKKKKIVAIIAVVIIFMLGLLYIVFNNSNLVTSDEKDRVITNNEASKELQKIKVSEVTRSVFYAPQYAAISNGYFAEEGIDIDLVTGQGADNVMTAVLSNQVDIGFAGPEAAIYVYNEGKEDYAQVFAQVTKTDGSFLVSSEKIDDFKWDNVKGKTVIPGRKGGVPYMTLLYVLKKNGIDPIKDVVLDDSIDFDLMASAFSTGEADFVTLFEPTATSIELAGKGHIVTAVGEHAEEIPYTAYFAKKSYINENKEIIQKFTNAIYKGEQFVKTSSSEEVAKAIKDFFPDTDLDLLIKSVESYRKIDAWKDNPVMTKESFELLQEIIFDAGELEKKAVFEDVVNNSFAENVKK